MKILAISGGGSHGAWGAGLCKHITHGAEFPYDVIYGTSTGALMSVLVMLGKYDALKEAYTDIKQSDIFSVDPFNRRGGLSIANAVWRVLTRKKTLGESERLRDRIRKYFKPEDHALIKASGRDVVFCVYNTTDSRVEYKRLSQHTYEETVDWIWASANIPIIMSLSNIGGKEYTDGGMADHVPLRDIQASHGDVERVDIIVHRTGEKKPRTKITGILSNIVYSIEAFSLEISNSDMLKLYEFSDYCDVDVYNMEHDPPFSSSSFCRDNMLKLWESGERGECRYRRHQKSKNIE